MKCLQFDFVAILMNETLDEPSQTNLPSAWEPFIKDPETITVLFFTVNMLLEKIIAMQGNQSVQKNLEKAKSLVVSTLRCL